MHAREDACAIVMRRRLQSTHRCLSLKDCASQTVQSVHAGMSVTLAFTQQHNQLIGVQSNCSLQDTTPAENSIIPALLKANNKATGTVLTPL